MSYEPVYFSPSTTLLLPGRHVIGKLDFKKAGNEERIEWKSFDPAIRSEKVHLEIFTSNGKKYGKITNHMNDILYLFPKVLFGYVISDPYRKWKFVLQKKEITIDLEEFHIPVEILSFDKAQQIYKNVSSMMIQEGIELSRTLNDEQKMLTYFLIRLV